MNIILPISTEITFIDAYYVIFITIIFSYEYSLCKKGLFDYEYSVNVVTQ